MNKSNMLELHADALAERVNEGENNTAFFRACLGLETTALDDDAAARIAELEAQLAEALMSAYVAERHRETAEESESVANARLKEAEEREAKMRAILEGAGYDDLDDLDDTLTRDIEDCRGVGETVGDITQNHIEYAGKADARIAELEARLAEESAQHRRWYDGAVNLGAKVELLEARLKEAEARAEAYRGWLEGFEVEGLDSLAAKSAEEARHWGKVAAGIHSLTIQRANRACEERSKAEADAGRLRSACQNLADAVARTRKADDAVSRNSGFTADWDEHEDAHASLIIFENAARAALSHAEAGEGKK